MIKTTPYNYAHSLLPGYIEVHSLSSAGPEDTFKDVPYVIAIGACCIAALILVLLGVLTYWVWRLRQGHR